MQKIRAAVPTIASPAFPAHGAESTAGKAGRGSSNEGAKRPGRCLPSGCICAKYALGQGRTGRSAVDDFIARRRELQELEAQMQLARKSIPRVALLHGAQGMGKSALIRETIARSKGFSLIHASGDEAEQGLAWGVVAQLLADETRVAPSTGPSTDKLGHQDLLVVGTHLLRRFEELQAYGPVLVVVDDAQWADRPSLQALSFAMRRLHVDPVVAVIATRETGDLPEGLRRLAQERGTMVRLEGLTCEELGELSLRLGAGRLPPRALQRLRDHTGGNPLHARALLEELPPDALSRGEGSLPAPRSFALLVISRLAACSRDARRLVEAASVIGMQSDLALLCQVSGIADPTAALDEAAAANLVEATDTSTGVVAAFAHSMVRAAVYDSLTRGARSTFHAKAGELLDGSTSLRHRAAAALLPDPALTAEVLEAAREETACGNHLLAARWLLAAARLDPDRGAREQHMLHGVEHLLAAGEVAEAATFSERLREMADRPLRHYVQGHLALLGGRQREAEQLLRSAWDDAHPGQESELRTLASEQLADLYAFQVRPEDAIAWARRAVDAAPDSSVGASALTTLVVYLALVGRPGEALPLVASLPEDPGHPTACDRAGMLARGIVRMWMGELDEAHADLSTVLEGTELTLGSRTGLITLGYLSQAEYLRGRWADSVRYAELSLAVATDTGQAWLLPLLHATASWPLSARGQWEAAEEHVRAAKEAAQAVGDAMSVAHADDAEVRLAHCRQDHERVVAVAERLLSMSGRAVVDEPAVFVWRELHAEALVASSQLDEATKALAALEEKLATRPRRRLARANAARVRANLDAACSNDEGARESFEAGLALLDSVNAPFERALLADALGRFLRRLGQRRAAASHLRTALDSFGALGARPFLERTERELTACGLRPRPRDSSAAVRLTPQELAVAQLVAEGRTNRGVADVLMVSHKTVEYHLSHLFTKLGIGSRRELREWLGRSSP
jgi:ATP/maltotriose-dependent transcriptional regulator MalT